MITLENWAYIRRQVVEGVPKKAIAEELGISRTTVTKLAKMTEPPRYERTPTAVSFATVEPRARALLSEFPEIPASVLADHRIFALSADQAAEWDRVNETPARQLPGLFDLMERTRPFIRNDD